MFYIFLVFYTYPAINEGKKHTEKEASKKVQKSVILLKHSNRKQNIG